MINEENLISSQKSIRKEIESILFDESIDPKLRETKLTELRNEEVKLLRLMRGNDIGPV